MNVLAQLNQAHRLASCQIPYGNWNNCGKWHRQNQKYPVCERIHWGKSSITMKMVDTIWILDLCRIKGGEGGSFLLPKWSIGGTVLVF